MSEAKDLKTRYSEIISATNKLERELVYKGDFEQGEKDGQGKYFLRGNHYIGQLSKGTIKGEGIMRYRNGDTYSGQWNNNKRDGKGVLKTTTGAVFEGKWKEGEIYQGTYTDQ